MPSTLQVQGAQITRNSLQGYTPSTLPSHLTASQGWGFKPGKVGRALGASGLHQIGSGTSEPRRWVAAPSGQLQDG